MAACTSPTNSGARIRRVGPDGIITTVAGTAPTALQRRRRAGDSGDIGDSL